MKKGFLVFLCLLFPAAVWPGERPFWTEQTSSRSGDILYAVGVASGVDSLENGRRLAFENGKDEIRNYIQMTDLSGIVIATQMTFEEDAEDGGFNVFRLLKCDLARLSKAKRKALKKKGSAAPSRRAVAVLNFESVRTEAELGVAISEVVRGVLSGLDVPQYRFVERQNTNEALRKRDLSVAAGLSEEQALNVGRALHVDYVIAGSVLKFGEEFTLTGRLIKSAGGEVVTSRSEKASGEGTLPDAAKKLALGLFGLETASVAGAVPAATEDGTATSSFRGGTYSTWYTDGRGKHTGGTVTLDVEGDRITGTSREASAVYDMSASLVGKKLVGYYTGRAGAGHGNFEFDIEKDGKKIVGSYYQVSNGAHGDWVGTRLPDKPKNPYGRSRKPTLALQGNKTVFSSGQQVSVFFTAPGDYPQDAWVGIIPSEIPHGKEIINDQHDTVYQYIGKRTEGVMVFDVPRRGGSYDLRMHDTDHNGREVSSVTFSVR